MSIIGVRRALARSEAKGLAERVNARLLAEEGRRGWPLLFCSAERLFSVEARLGWVEPDLAPLPQTAGWTSDVRHGWNANIGAPLALPK